LVSFGFQVNKVNTNKHKIVIITLYVNHYLIINDKKKEGNKKYKRLLSDEYEMMDQGPLQFVIGLQVERNWLNKRLS
jgi:hypothetical protein